MIDNTPLVITLDTSPNDNSFRFIKTMINNNWEFKLIGTDTKWVSFIHRCIHYRNELINISKINPKKVCVISDCKDVLCLRTSKYFIELFKEFNSGIVVSSEILCAGYSSTEILPEDEFEKFNCNPLYKYWEFKGYDKDNLPVRKYVNAGLICGYAGDLIEMYNWIIEKGFEIGLGDDQVIMGMYMNENPNKVEVDFHAKLLHTSVFGVTCGYLNKHQKEDSPSISELMGRGSFFLHLPGLETGKGNFIIYEIMSLLIDNGYNNNMFIKPYDFNENSIPPYWYLEDILIKEKK